MTNTQRVWQPYNVQALIRNVELVFKSGHIAKLNKPTYEFITLHMGFIAHYDLAGFQAEYKDLRRFCQNLQTSEYSTDRDHNLKWAVRRETDKFFRDQYGAAYNHSIAQAIRGIIAVARKYEDRMAGVFGQLEKERDLAQVKRILTKYGLSHFELHLKGDASD